MNGKTLLIVLALVTTLGRLAVVWFDQPSPSEAYYFLCAERPAPAYFDGPGGTATVARWAGEFWRMTSPLWALAATVLCFALVRRLSDAKTAAWTALGLNLLPLFNIAGVQTSPLLPALTFLLAALLSTWKAFESEKNDGLPWYLVTGVCLSLGAWFSYAVVPFALGVVLFILCSPKHRRPVDYIGLCLMALMLVAALVPSLEWNARQDWIPLAGGTFRTLWQLNGPGFLYSVRDSLITLSPLVCIGLPIVWVAAARSIHQRVKPRFVFLATLPGVILWGYFCLRGINSAFFLLLAAPLLIFQALAFAHPVAKALTRFALLVSVLFSAAILVQATQAGDPWKHAADKVREVFFAKADSGTDGLFLIAADEDLASVLGYHLRDDLIPPIGHPAVYVRESQDISSQFGLWPSYDDFVETDHHADEYFKEQGGENPFMGRSALYVSDETPEDLPQTIKAAFSSVTPLEQIPPQRGLSRPLYIYFCENYQTLPL